MISLPYPPSTNRYWKNFRGRMVTSKEATEYKRLAALAALYAGINPKDPTSGYPLTGAVELVIELHPKLTKGKPGRPATEGKGGKPGRPAVEPTPGRESGTRMDLDNVLKIAIDSMNGIAYTDDKQVRRLSAQIGLPIEGGGLSVWIAPYTGATGDFAPITGGEE